MRFIAFHQPRYGTRPTRPISKKGAHMPNTSALFESCRVSRSAK